jgi:hypothetical protein
MLSGHGRLAAKQLNVSYVGTQRCRAFELNKAKIIQRFFQHHTNVAIYLVD